MRLSLFLACFLSPLVAVAGPLDCKDTGLRPNHLLSASEMDLATRGTPSSDPIISEASFLLNKASDDISAEEMRRAGSISWSQARRLLLLGAVTRLHSSPGASVYLMTRSGKFYSTKVTSPDDLWDLVRLVDPCGIYITVWQP